MAEAERGNAGGVASRFKLILEKVTTAARAAKSKLWPPPPPLPVTQNPRQLKIGKLAFNMGATAMIGLLLYDQFSAGEAHYYVILGLMSGCAAVLNGILFEKTSVEVAGIGLILLSFDVLVASFLPVKFWWACWLLASSALIPLLYVLIKP